MEDRRNNEGTVRIIEKRIGTILQKIGKAVERQSLTISISSITIIFALILWLTIISRQVTIEIMQPRLLWSYKEWISGNWTTGKQIIGNIILFIPIGLLLCSITAKKKYLFIPILFSLSIETVQLVTMRGLFEFDDIINNTLGIIIGWTAAKFISKKHIPYLGIASSAHKDIARELIWKYLKKQKKYSNVWG